VVNHPSNDSVILIGSKNEIYSWDLREKNSNTPAQTYKSSMNQVQDLVFIDDQIFISAGDVVSKDSAEFSLIAWDFESCARISTQIFHVSFAQTHNLDLILK
jgi:hypothetical protein